MARSKDVERSYRTSEIAAKLRRLADALEERKPFRIQVAGRRVQVPPDVAVTIEHERRRNTEEVDIELRWTRK
ncbi:MAG: amphi-Trp domain-containing protein [Candidatus Eisenbacteria bacterium]|nr:amphi-Trp domain-containing protein [Candidatus Eisenbacteria bacterium]